MVRCTMNNIYGTIISGNYMTIILVPVDCRGYLALFKGMVRPLLCCSPVGPFSIGFFLN